MLSHWWVYSYYSFANNIDTTMKNKQINITDQYGEIVPDHLQMEILTQDIFFSDKDSRHWFFDFKLTDGRWCSCLEINNELTEIKVEIF